MLQWQAFRRRLSQDNMRRLPILLLTLLLAGCNLKAPDDPFMGAAITNPAFPSLTYSIQAFLWWDGGEVGTNLDYVRMMGFTHVKQTFAWRDLEPRPDEWDFTESDRIVDAVTSRRLKLIARLGDVPDWAHVAIDPASDVHDTPPIDLSRWANYCATLATQYRGRIAAYQIWNEPNLSREWGGNRPDAAAYAELLGVCADAIRAADPDARLISAGLAPTGTDDARATPDDRYLQAMYDAGFQQYVDAVGVHAPGYSKPETDPAAVDGRWATFRRVEDLRKIMIANNDAARQMAILEVGWTIRPPDPNLHPDYAWFAVTEAEQAQYLRDGYAYAAEHWRPWMGLMSAIYLAPPGWTPNDEEYWFSITYPGPNPGDVFTRQAVDALLRMPKYCGEVYVPEWTQQETPVERDNPCL